MPDYKVIELEAKIAKLTAIMEDPSPLYKEYIYKDDEKTIKPNLKIKEIDELNEAIIRQSKHVEEFMDSIKKEEIEIPASTKEYFENSIKVKDEFLNIGSIKWDPESGFIDPSFYIENDELYFKFKNEDIIDYAEITEISKDGKIITTTQGGTIGDGIYIKVPVLVDYLEKGSIGTKYTVTIVTTDRKNPRNIRKGFFTYAYK